MAAERERKDKNYIKNHGRERWNDVKKLSLIGIDDTADDTNGDTDQ